MKKTKTTETNEITALREKYEEAKAHYEKTNNTHAKVTAKVETLEQSIAKHIFACKDAEKGFQVAEKNYLREEISKAQFEEITKKQKDSAKALSEAERSIKVARQVIEDLNREIRAAVEHMNIARTRLSAGIRARLISEIPDTVADKLLEIYVTFPEANWEWVLSQTFAAPHLEKIKEARAEFNKRLKNNG